MSFTHDLPRAAGLQGLAISVNTRKLNHQVLSKHLAIPTLVNSTPDHVGSASAFSVILLLLSSSVPSRVFPCQFILRRSDAFCALSADRPRHQSRFRNHEPPCENVMVFPSCSLRDQITILINPSHPLMANTCYTCPLQQPFQGVYLLQPSFNLAVRFSFQITVRNIDFIDTGILSKVFLFSNQQALSWECQHPRFNQ